MKKEKTAKDPQKDARIMRAALQAFAQDGYRDAKTETIAANAEVSKGLIFHYYGSKQGLYVHTVRTAIQTTLDTINPRVYEAPSDLVALIVRGTKYKTEFGRTHPDEMRLMINAYGELDQLPAKVQIQMKAVYDQSIEITRKLIREVLAQMTIRPEVNRDDVVDLIVGVYNQIFAEFQEHMSKNNDIKSMDDVQWIVERAKTYMSILEYGFTEPQA